MGHLENVEKTINAINVSGLFDHSNEVYKYLKANCGTDNDTCKNGAAHNLKICEEKKIADCENIIKEGAVKYCKENYAAMCTQWLPTTTTTSTSGPNLLPFIIGGVVGVIVLLVVAIGLFCYCRRKKKMGKNQTMTGTTTGGTSGTGTGTATGTITKTGTTQATGTNTCVKY